MLIPTIITYEVSLGRSFALFAPYVLAKDLIHDA
jgi:hypothetical protein